MRKFCFVAITGLFALWLQVSAANAGVIFPLLILEVFYLTVAFGWKWGLGSSLALCLILDSLLAYNSLPSMIVVVVCALSWKAVGDCSRLELQFLPVALVTALSMLVLFFTLFVKYGRGVPLLSGTLHFLVAVAGSALLAPFYIRSLDYLAGNLKIITYSEIQREELYGGSV